MSPTFQEQGATSKCFELTGFQTCSVPAGTPKEIVKKISELLVEAGKSDKVQEMMKTFGVDEPAMTLRGDAEALRTKRSRSGSNS